MVDFSVFNVISLLGGIALFLYGMRIMGDGLKQGSSGTIKKAMEKVTNNVFIAFLLGMLVTALIQSSTATIVLTAGLVGAGMIKLKQSIGIILGANVGTTITGQIIRLIDIKNDSTSLLNIFKPSTLAPIAALLGIILIMAFKFKNSNTIGTISMGFGILFTGLLNMTASVEPLKNSEIFGNMFMGLADKPVLGFLAGVLVAFSIQSSSASVGILQALSQTGKLTFAAVYPIIIGIYIGDCVTTAIVCSIGAKEDPKRVGLMHILFNIGEVILVIACVSVLYSTGLLNSIWSKPGFTSGDIANTHTIFKLSTAIILLPVCFFFEKIARKIIKDPKKEPRKIDEVIGSLDKDFYKTPAVALSAAHNVLSAMATLACSNVITSLNNLLDYSENKSDEVRENEAQIDEMADLVSNYLIGLSPYVNADNGNEKLNFYIRCVSEFERIGDYADNLIEIGDKMAEKKTSFSEAGVKEIRIVQKAIMEIITYASDAFIKNNRELSTHIEPIEEVIDDIIDKLRNNHIKRLRENKCNVYAGCYFMDALVNLERISDHCSNIGVHIITLLDERNTELEHDYIDYLHQGNDENYNREFSNLRDIYLGMLSDIEEKEDSQMTIKI